MDALLHKADGSRPINCGARRFIEDKARARSASLGGTPLYWLFRTSRTASNGLSVCSVRALGPSSRSLKWLLIESVFQRSLNRGLGLDVETTKVSDFFALLRATYILDLAYSVDVN